MPAQQTLDAWAAELNRTVGVVNSATALISGFAARVQAAIDAAIADGATAAQLATVQDEVDAIRASTDNLAAAVAANP